MDLATLAGRSEGLDEAGHPWFSLIQGFYIEAKADFFKSWDDARELAISKLDVDLVFGERPTVWKTIGDEILFVKEITNHRQVSTTLNCWIKALLSIRQSLKLKNKALDVKSVAWTAGFPCENKEVVIGGPDAEITKLNDDYFVESGKILNQHYTEGASSRIVVDYVGPSIDIGFRLAAHSTKRRFVIGVDIAYIIALTNQSKFSEKLIEVNFGSTFQLKGVHDGIPYPVFWIDVDDPDDLSMLEASLTKGSRENIQNYCEQFYRSNAKFVFRPFICNQTEQELNVPADWFHDEHRHLVNSFNNPPSVIDDDNEQVGESASPEMLDSAAEIGMGLVKPAETSADDLSTRSK